MDILKKGIVASLVLCSFKANAQADTNKLPKESAIVAGVMTEALFPGGNGAWYKFLSKNLNTYVATDKGAPAGNYTVKVEFWIETTGKVTEVKPLTDFGFGMEEELMRVINKSISWIPGKQGDRLLRVKKSQSITFKVDI